MKQALLAENLCKKYGRGDTGVTAMDNVAISLDTGEVVALLGPSVAGKSTLLTALGLIRPPDSGRIVIDGTVVFDNGYKTDVRAFRRSNIGFVFQKANLLPFLTARENVQLPMELDDISGGKSRRRAMELLEQFGMENRQGFKPSELSGGQQQRVAIARALANCPKLLFADEPTAALDSVMGRKVMEMMKRVAHDFQTSVLVVTHDTRALDVFDRILRMEDGKIGEK